MAELSCVSRESFSESVSGFHAVPGLLREGGKNGNAAFVWDNSRDLSHSLFLEVKKVARPAVVCSAFRPYIIKLESCASCVMHVSGLRGSAPARKLRSCPRQSRAVAGPVPARKGKLRL